MITLQEYLQYDKEWTLDWNDVGDEVWSNPHADEIREYNKALVERYPFLIPRNAWTDELTEDYTYTWTELDSMPTGWRIRFGDEMVEEINQELKKFNYENEYRILQIKEKWGELRWYDGAIPHGCNVWKIIEKYSALSRIICIKCGDLATKESQGWISPYCEDCAQELEATGYEQFRDITIEEYDIIDKAIKKIEQF